MWALLCFLYFVFVFLNLLPRESKMSERIPTKKGK